ncbi:MAG TPA: ADOP family duplicated permease [Thermoanaerobaculia bacterium]|nr:ADOP family duplicated permease [Thermoanaerobaculia bacterium]
MLSEIRSTLRSLWARPAFTAGTLLTLTLGTGPVLLLFAIVNTILLMPVPARHPERMVMVLEAAMDRAGEQGPVSPANFLDLRAGSTVYSILAAAQLDSATFTGLAEPVGVDVGRVSWNYLSLCQLEVLAGRGFLPEEDRSGTPRSVILSEPIWRRHFAADPAVVGRSIEIDGLPHEVVGVVRAPFLVRQEAWVPLAIDPSLASRSRRSLIVFGELAPGVALSTAREQMQQLARRLAEAHPEENRHLGIAADPVLERLSATLRPALLALLVMGGLLLLLATVNAASLQAARALERDRELALRIALGAGRWPLARLVLVESLVLVSVSVALALITTQAGLSLLAASGLDAIPRLSEMRIDRQTLGFAGLMLAGVTLLCALLPLRVASSVEALETLRSTTAGARSGVRGWLRGSLVGLEVALALVLVSSAVLAFASFQRLTRSDLGLDATRVASVEITLPEGDYPSPAEQRLAFSRLLERLRATPGVEEAGLASPMVLSRRRLSRPFRPEEGGDDRSRGSALVRTVAPGTLEALRIHKVAGRFFEERDAETSAPVVVVNEALARRAWPGQEAVGKRLRLGQGEDEALAWQVIGVAGNVRQGELDYRVGPELYFSHLQAPVAGATLLARSSTSALAATTALRAAVLAEAPGVALRRLEPLEAAFDRALARPRYGVLLLSLMALLALALAALGVYAVTRHQVQGRLREVGIRLALGAERGRVVAQFGRRLGVGVLGGVAFGLLGAMAMRRVLSSLLFGAPQAALGPFTLALSILLGVALLALTLPIWNVARANPARALRSGD